MYMAGMEAGAVGWMAAKVLSKSRARTDDGPGV